MRGWAAGVHRRDACATLAVFFDDVAHVVDEGFEGVVGVGVGGFYGGGVVGFQALHGAGVGFFDEGVGWGVGVDVGLGVFGEEFAGGVEAGFGEVFGVGDGVHAGEVEDGEAGAAGGFIVFRIDGGGGADDGLDDGAVAEDFDLKTGEIAVELEVGTGGGVGEDLLEVFFGDAEGGGDGGGIGEVGGEGVEEGGGGGVVGFGGHGAPRELESLGVWEFGS